MSNWLLLFLEEYLKNKLYCVEHAWPVSSQYSRTKIIRNIMRIMADIVITYTKQAQDLQEKMKKKKILVASNALYFKKRK